MKFFFLRFNFKNFFIFHLWKRIEKTRKNRQSLYHVKKNRLSHNKGEKAEKRYIMCNILEKANDIHKSEKVLKKETYHLSC